ncbi:MAG: LacI family DNA-binding transcriptional regulator [Devosia sp.]|uniref:LacI family DNA-binding transcriptional regulator n=1 Tax=Devosia sp. TaxID=1871048 RepID=UPI001AC5A215|nr:LacI family DNA-binding transcriptional regulator [Devosia sp.]MBN9309514.1 LacI family DNA-binding transcriptional regulator [Devosia sp.]MBN9314681.1 LacI family DNA-binding transcriptional regulator [Devosia sp.]
MTASRKSPTIQDVARHANVSAATVSRVLSAPERVSETTRERVHAAVSETGYTINQAARSLRLKAARTILMAAPNIGNPYYSTVLDAVIGEASSRGYSVLVATRIGDDPNRWLHDYLLSTRADGLLLFDGSLDTNSLHGLGAEGVALPLVAAYDEIPDPKVNSVITDNRLAAKRAVRHLADLGHTKIAHVIGPSRNQSTNERLLGFQEAMRELGLPVRQEWLHPGAYNTESGTAAAAQFLASGELPTAVFCGNDEMAVGLIHGMRQAGIECPRDISVVGFDDVSFAPYYNPPLTTMRQPREEIGRMATRSLIDIIEGGAKESDPVHVVLTSELIVRESTRTIR